MPIQYADVDLLLEDPEGKVCRLINRYLSTDGMQLFGPLTAWIGGRSNARSQVRQFANLPVPNYPDPPKLKINTLYWPTGASRWSVGLFLADDAKLTEVRNNLNADGPDGRGNAARLKLWDNDGPPFAVNGAWMHLLPPRKLSATVTGSNGVWILPLVDERYFWQFKRFDGTTDSWSELLDSIRDTVLSADDWEQDSISSAYGLPHCVEFKREDESVAMVLDAAAHCLGMRFVLDTHYNTGSRHQTGLLKNHTTAELTLNSNIHGFLSNGGILAGGEFSNGHFTVAKPEKVVIVFPNDDKTEVGDTKEVDIGGDVGGTWKIFHEAADTQITTDSWRQALAEKVASDFKGWCARHYEVTYPGIVDWRPNGFDNWIEFSVGKRIKGSVYKMQTRVCSMPYNFGVENLAHQEEDDCPDGDDNTIPNSPCDCCKGCVCYPDDDDDVTDACGAIGCLLKLYRIVSQDLPFPNLEPNLAWVSGCIFESNSFEVVICGKSFGDHHWKLTVASGCCGTKLELINDGTGAGVPLKYTSVRPFRMLCATEFAFEENCDLYDDDDLKSVAHTYPTKLCVNPVGNTDCQPCNTNISSLCCPDGFPQVITATIRDESPSACVLDGVAVPMLFDSYLGGDTSHPIWIGTYDAGGSCGVLTFRYEVTGVMGGGCDRQFTIKNAGGTTCFSGGGGPACPMVNHSFGPVNWGCTGCCGIGTGVLMYVDFTV